MRRADARSDDYADARSAVRTTGILAVMSSLALVAQHSAAAVPAFNGGFYSTIATIIPVLFLAIAVQGTAYGILVKTVAYGIRLYRRAMPVTSTVIRMSPLTGAWVLAVVVIGAWLALGVLVLVSVLTLISGLAGEIIAVIALYRQHAIAGSGAFVLGATIFLVVMTAAGPAWALGRSLVQAVRQQLDDAKPGTDAESQSGNEPCSEAERVPEQDRSMQPTESASALGGDQPSGTQDR
jgi:hypothetical protein